MWKERNTMATGLTKRLLHLLFFMYLSTFPIGAHTDATFHDFSAMGLSPTDPSAVQHFAIFNDLDNTDSGQGVIIKLELARTPQEISRGLMFRDHLDENQGMLFIFDSEQPRRFWMKNTLVPLDIIFISEDFRIVSAVVNAQPCRRNPCTVYRSRTPAKYVLEVSGGFMQRHHILVGSQVELKIGPGGNSPL